MYLGDYVVRESTKVAQAAIEGIRLGRIRTLGELDDFVSGSLGQSAADVAAMFTGSSSPMVQSLVESMKPAVMQVLQDYTPTFAAVSGGMLALAVLLGVYVAKETFQRTRR